MANKQGKMVCVPNLRIALLIRGEDEWSGQTKANNFCESRPVTYVNIRSASGSPTCHEFYYMADHRFAASLLRWKAYRCLFS